MDLGMLGINLALIAGIIAITELIKKLDKGGKLSRVYVLIPLVLGIVGAVFATSPLTWQGVGLNAIIYAGIASYLYNAGKKLTIGGVTIDASAEAVQTSEAISSATATAVAGELAKEPEPLKAQAVAESLPKAGA